MERLSTTTLSKVMPAVETPGYARASVSSGIVHFGAGNFHRAHQAVYCDALLNEGETGWGITGVSLRSPAMRDNLAPQDFFYTQATLGATTAYRIIGAIQNVLVAPENPQAVIEAVARNQTQLVTTTITEKGYCLSSGVIDRAHPGISRDLESLSQPQTTYGYLAAAMIKRCADQGAPLTILCCDNMHAGGEHLRSGVLMLLERHSPATLSWVAANVAFSSSMVDRVTPATDEPLKKTVAERLGLYDAAPVAAEPFSQWIIEDRFAGERPPFDRVGALFVEDIAPFERIKLRFLNAGHSMLAALGYLAGDRFIHEALQRPALARFTEQALKGNVLPVTPVPAGVSGEGYIDQVLERFRNGNLPYAVLQVGTDSSQKIQQRWLPTIDDALSQGQGATYLAFALAAWASFIRQALLNNDLNDPLRDAFGRCESTATTADVEDFLALAGAGKFTFFTDVEFMAAVREHHRAIAEVGVVQAVDSFLTN
ncbi:mannitol dehydrogenase family protein [Pseudomaricurvus alcaniphilus]|uniref:mannitol dehydrogenase family protein n=1 Tax=Pseudomaricurvus alcaniphilus TaxID=1166482 RepID=UPI00140A5A86|nr:mannitol dehydrogenase family protein [Pseudomaricurvus alcaniphilus]NHN37748.1 mannitol dehydrogenase family protein [Pseudomaricurvus alcaniphilus]